MAEQAPLLGQAERRAAGRARPCGRRRGASAAASSRSGRSARMELRRLAAERRDADGVLEQAAGVAVVPVRGRGKLARASGGSRRRRGSGRPSRAGRGAMISAARNSRNPSSSSASRRIAGASAAGVFVRSRLERADSSWSRSRNRSTRPSTRTASPSPNRASSRSTSVQTRASIRPLGSTSSSARYGAPPLRAQPLLPRDGVDALDDPVCGQLCDRAHGASLGVGAAARLGRSGRRQAVPRAPLRRAERPRVVAPPYDVISRRGARALPRARARTTSST